MKVFKCPQCGGMTKLNRKCDKLPDGIQHDYFKCDCCKSKTTIQYTDVEIRKMLARQKDLQNNPRLPLTQEERAQEGETNQMLIIAKMNALKAKITA